MVRVLLQKLTVIQLIKILPPLTESIMMMSESKDLEEGSQLKILH
jgi:hypothetical protein